MKHNQTTGMANSILLKVSSLAESLSTEFFSAFTSLGSLFVVWIIPVAAYLRGEKEFSYRAIKGLLTVSAIVYPLKFLIGRPRPSTASTFLTPSFPSGHAAVAFALAYIIANKYSELSSIAYVSAILVGVSRIFLGVHYSTDVLVGSLIGLAAGYFVVNYV